MNANGKPNIFVAIPVYEKLEVRMITALDAHIQQAVKLGYGIYKDFAVGDGCISRARNMQLTRFYEDSRFDWYLQISGDIVIKNDPVQENVFVLLTNNGAEFTGGLYPKSVYQYGPVEPTSQLNGWSKDHGLRGCDKLSGGLLAVRRNVVEEMQSYYGNKLDWVTTGGEQVRGLMTEMYEELGDGKRTWLSEDFAFCKRWTDTGGEIWADSRVKLAHVGAFEYRLGAT